MNVFTPIDGLIISDHFDATDNWPAGAADRSVRCLAGPDNERPGVRGRDDSLFAVAERQLVINLSLPRRHIVDHEPAFGVGPRGKVHLQRRKMTNAVAVTECDIV